MPLTEPQALPLGVLEGLLLKDAEPVKDAVMVTEVLCVGLMEKVLEKEAVGDTLCEAEAHCVGVEQRVVLRVRVPEPHWLRVMDCDTVPVRVGEPVLDCEALRVRVPLPVALPPVADRLRVGV